MTYIFRQGGYNVTDAARATITQPGAAAASQWWLGPWAGFPLAAAIATANCAAAYRAVATVGSVWGAGPTSLAESYVNLNSPGVNDAAPGAAPTWAAATGWTFAGAQYLTTGIAPAPLPGWTMLIQYTDSLLGNTIIAGAISTLVPAFGFMLRIRAINQMYAYGCASGTFAINAPALLVGNYAIARLLPYRDGVAEPNADAATATNGLLGMFIGAGNVNGAATQYYTGKIRALAIYRIELDANQMAALGTAATGAMAQL